MSTKAQNIAIPLTLNLAQVNLVLEGLGKLPHERVDALVTGIRSEAVRQLQAAEKAAQAAAEPPHQVE